MPMMKETMLKRLLLPIAAAGGGGSAPVEDTATGNPLTFITDVRKPLKSLLIPFTPQQEGSGDPSPTNIRPLLPWNGLTVWQAGANLADFTIVQGGIAGATGEENKSPNRVKTKDAFFVKGNGTKYTIDADGVGAVWIYNYNLDGSYSESQDKQGFKSLPYTYTMNGGDCLLKLAFRVTTAEEIAVSPSDISNVRFQVGTTISPFETADVSEHKAVFPSPVYGGTLDVVSGVLTVEWALFTAKWKDGINASDRGNNIRKQFAMPISFVNATEQVTAYCNVARWRWNFESDDVHFFAHVNNAYVFLPEETDGETEINIVGKLATPQTVQLTPTQLTALLGNNTIWSDADGQMMAVYLKKG